jgi:predicted TIM-barrel fold metal-dependent hydrolase
MKRRSAIFSALGLTAGAVGWAIWPREGMWNPCRGLPMPERLAKHEIVQAAWAGLDATKAWDVHVHLAGLGGGKSRVWVNPKMQSVFHPFEYVHAQFYANAACATDQNAEVTDTYVERLYALQQRRPIGAKLMLLAMEHFHDDLGNRIPERTVFYVPNDYAAEVVALHPERFEWVASVHPYRADCLEALEWAKNHGARAVKWIPSAMNIDPASKRCNPFYDALKRLNLPLISHGGYEHPLLGSGALQALNNPLALRRPLERGVRVIVAHCASTGTDIDTDLGKNGPEVECFSLFARMMDEPQFVGLLFGDISALTETSRVGPLLQSVLERSHWHTRLLNGSDYPLPGYLPEVSLNRLVEYKFISKEVGKVLRGIREYDPLLFDFVLKRHIGVGNQRFPASVFETAAFFISPATV